MTRRDVLARCDICDICGKPHPEFQLSGRVAAAQLWYETTGEPTAVIHSRHGYDYTVLSDPDLANYRQVLQIPGGWVL